MEGRPAVAAVSIQERVSPWKIRDKQCCRDSRKVVRCSLFVGSAVDAVPMHRMSIVYSVQDFWLAVGVMPPHNTDACADIVCQETDCLEAGTCINGVCSVGLPKGDGTSCGVGTCQQGICTGGYKHGLVSAVRDWWNDYQQFTIAPHRIHCNHTDRLPLAAPGSLHPTDPCAGVVCQTTQCRNAGVCTDGACSMGAPKEDGISCEGGTCQQGVCIGS